MWEESEFNFNSLVQRLSKLSNNKMHLYCFNHVYVRHLCFDELL